MESTSKRPHSVSIEARNRATVTGVDKVVSAFENAIVLNTSEGALTISGKELKIKKFSADDGVLAFEGIVDSLKYSAVKGGSVVKKLFK